MNSIYTIATNCASVTYGNIAQHVKEIIKNFFPSDFFNYEHISSEIAYRNIRRLTLNNKSKDIVARKKPHLIIRPIFSVPDDMYLYDTPLTSNMDNLEKGMDNRATFPILQDNTNGIGLSYKLNRDKIEFQVTVNLSTSYQQIDIYKSLANIIFWNRPHTKRLPTESMIPRGLMRALALSQNIDINNERYAAGIFLDYLNRYSNSPITYKMRNGTAADEYFVYQNQLVLFTFSDLQIEEGNKKNMADDVYPITFRVTAEFNVPGLFILYGDSYLKDKIITDAVIVELKTENSISFPLFTIENLFVDSTDPNGFRKFKSSILQMERNKDGNDITDFGCLLSTELISILREYYANKVDISTIAKLYLFKNNLQLVEDIDYKIDWNKTELCTYNPDLESSYRIILYLNMIKINELLVNKTDDSQTERPGLNLN